MKKTLVIVVVLVLFALLFLNWYTTKSEQATKSETLEEPEYLLCKRDYSVTPSDNETGVIVTPNDIIASGILTDMDSYREYYDKRFEKLKSGDSDGTFLLSFSQRVSYTFNDYHFTSFTIQSGESENSNVHSCIIKLNYDGDYLTSITVGEGEEDETVITWTIGEDNKPVSAKVTGGGVEQETDKDNTEICRVIGGMEFYLNCSDSYFTVSFAGIMRPVQLVLETDDFGTGIRELKVSDRLCLYGTIRSTRLDAFKFEGGTELWYGPHLNEKYICARDTAPGTVEVSYNVDNQKCDYTFESGKFKSGYFSIRDGNYEHIFVDADGNIPHEETPAFDGERERPQKEIPATA